MLMPNAALPTVIFWQWANQTLNVAVSCHDLPARPLRGSTLRLPVVEEADLDRY
jgi:hypothetical protein